MKQVVSVIGLSIFLTLTFVAQSFSQELIVYSARKEHLIQPLFEAYTKETGTKIKYITVIVR